jgi:hypothetical protein
MSKPHDDRKDEPKPYSTYFEYERQRILGPGEDKVGTSGTVPLQQPPNSPWASDPVGPEPLVDRSIEDGPTINIHGE